MKHHGKLRFFGLQYKYALPALCFFAITFLVAIVVTSPCIASGGAQQELPRKWDKWLNEEVVYIISTREREIFLQLEADERRQLFVKKFWEARDPTPGTQQNEFREEHQRRIEYADRMFGYDSPGRGALTDRGRIYIILGPPRSKLDFPSGPNTYPMELWFYEVDPRKGVPPFFYLIFFKRFGTGDYELYDPITDGPQSLVANVSPRSLPYDVLEDLDGELARASLNYLPSESVPYEGKPSLSSLVLLHKIDQIKDIGINISYAEKILLGEETITTEYSFATTALAYEIFTSLDEGNRSYIDFAVEFSPDQVNLGQYRDKIYGAFKFDFLLADERGLTIYSETDEVDLNFTEEEFGTIKAQPLLYEKRLPSIPGSFNLNVTVKNEVTKEQYFITKSVDVPTPVFREFNASTVLLAQRIDRLQQVSFDAVRPMQFADVQLTPNPRKTFNANRPLSLYCQLFLPSSIRQQQSGAVNIQYSIMSFKGDEKINGEQEIPYNLFSDNGIFHFFMRWPLQDLSPGEYTVILKIDSGVGQRVLVRNSDFVIVPGSLKEPLQIGGEGLAFQSSKVLLALARMWQSRGESERAEGFMLAALNREPENHSLRLDLARLYFDTERYEKTIRVLEPELVENPNDAELLRYTAKSYFNLGEYSKAAKFLTRLIAQEGESVESLNLLGRAYFDSGQLEEAIDALQRSLRLDPEQEDIELLLQEAEEQKK